MLQKVLKSFYERDTICVAKELLGKYLIHNYLGQEYIGKIVEVEAYLGKHDLASHSSKGITPRTKVIYGPAGFACIYYAKDWAKKLLRFYIKDNAFISKP